MSNSILVIHITFLWNNKRVWNKPQRIGYADDNLNGMAPTYLQELHQYDKPSRILLSSNNNQFVMRYPNTKPGGNRAYISAVAEISINRLLKRVLFEFVNLVTDFSPDLPNFRQGGLVLFK